MTETNSSLKKILSTPVVLTCQIDKYVAVLITHKSLGTGSSFRQSVSQNSEEVLHSNFGVSVVDLYD